MPNNKIQSLTVDGVTYDIVDNTSGYLTSFTETDPTVPAWAKAANKPTYTASEVGALPDSTVIPTVPTNVSSFTNDAGYLTSSDIASVLKYKGTKASYSALPSSGNVTGDVWHLTDTGAEWAWDGSAWQELGTAIDLSNYALLDDLNDYATTDYVDQNFVKNYWADNAGSFITNDDGDGNGHIRMYNDTTGKETDIYWTISQGQNYNESAIGFIADHIRAVYIPTDTYDLTTKKYVDDSIGALTIPTKTSDLTNDSGFLTSYTETDPTVPSWAKQSSKPSYALSEITSADDIKAIEALTGTTGLLRKTAANTWSLDTNTYLTSYTETDPTVPSWAKQSTKPSYTAAEVGALPDSTTIPSKTSDLTNDSGFITSDFDEKLKTDTLSSGNMYLIGGSNNSVASTKYIHDGLNYQLGTGYCILGIGNGVNGCKGALRLYGSTSNTRIHIQHNATANRAITLPDADGTVALTSDIPSVYSSTNTSGYLTMATLPIYDGTVV